VSQDARRIGLCAACAHARRIRTARGSTFWHCARAATDARFARYPPLPVRRCPGHAPGEPTGAADDG
jgi:hypothetical protein